jgi:maltooligosyltrehalose trehalohydrolase
LEKTGYYADFGGTEPLVATLKDGWYYSGQHSKFRRRLHGNSPQEIARSRFIVCNQNHDQVGNRAAGERLFALVGIEASKLAAGITLLSPFTPLLFMGEEYGETAPFQYFTSHGDPALVEGVRKGRREEFAAFGWQDSVPDPQEEATFERSHLDHALKSREPHRTLLRFYQELLRIRREHDLGVQASWSIRELGDGALLMLRDKEGDQLAMFFNFSESPVACGPSDLESNYTTLLYSAEAQWGGPEAEFPDDFNLTSLCELRLHQRSFLVLKQISAAKEFA